MRMTDEPVRRPDAQNSTPAVAVETYVTEASGRWTVEIAVIFEDGVVHRTVNDYRTKRHAEIAAQWIKRGANRDIEGPVNG